jgi:hypothetical protein
MENVKLYHRPCRGHSAERDGNRGLQEMTWNQPPEHIRDSFPERCWIKPSGEAICHMEERWRWSGEGKPTGVMGRKSMQSKQVLFSNLRHFTGFCQRLFSSSEKLGGWAFISSSPWELVFTECSCVSQHD